MGFHSGDVKHRGEISFMLPGYWDVYQSCDGTECRTFRYYPNPRKQSRPIRKMYGFSIRGFFIGVMLFGKPEHEVEA